MRKNKLTHLLEPSLRLYFVFLLLSLIHISEPTRH